MKKVMDAPRHQLKLLLKGCRQRLHPENFGLADGEKRRCVLGLRRAEVAKLSGVSVTWYTWLEQGRPIRASDPVLERICEALRVTPEEREYVFRVVTGGAAPQTAHRGAVTASVQRMLREVDVPAVAITPRWDVLDWNPLAETLLGLRRSDTDRRNLLKTLIEVAVSHGNVEHESIVRHMLAKFRLDYIRHVPDAHFDELVEDLCAVSPTVRELWERPDVGGAFTPAIVTYPKRAGIRLEFVRYTSEESSSASVALFLPYDQTSRRELAALAASASAPDASSDAHRPTLVRRRSASTKG